MRIPNELDDIACEAASRRTAAAAAPPETATQALLVVLVSVPVSWAAKGVRTNGLPNRTTHVENDGLLVSPNTTGITAAIAAGPAYPPHTWTDIAFRFESEIKTGHRIVHNLNKRVCGNTLICGAGNEYKYNCGGLRGHINTLTVLP